MIDTYKAVFDAEYTANKTAFDALAASGDKRKQNYYDFQPVLMGTLSMYEATGEATYLERALTWAETMVGCATIVDRKGFKNWAGGWLGSPFIPRTGIAFTLQNLQGSVELARLCRIVMSTPALVARYGQRASAIFAFVRVNIVDKELAFQGTADNWISAYTTKYYSDKAAMMARILVNLTDTFIGIDYQYRSMAIKLLIAWQKRLTPFTGHSLVWDRNKYNNAGDSGTDHAIDTSHANRWAAWPLTRWRPKRSSRWIP